MTETPAPASQRPSPALIIFLILPLLGIAAAIVMIIQNERQNSGSDVLDLATYVERQAVALINYAAPPFTMTDLEGETVSLSDYQGRILFLNFWTTDCPPCEKEMPAFEMFTEEQGETGAAVLTVNVGEGEDAINKFFERINVSGVRVAMDTTLEVAGQYGVMARPITFVIDGQGVIRAMKAGEVTIDEMDAYIADIEAPDQVDEAS